MLFKKYKSLVVSILNPFKGIYTLELASVKGKYKYNPGQFLHLAVAEDYDGVGQWPESRCFSMQSSPENETILITYAVKGEFTKKMESQLRNNSEIWIKLPYGDLFTQEHSKTNTVFIAGGTGITPFLSLFLDSSFSKYIHPKIYLGFKSKEYNIYQTELAESRVSFDAITLFYEDIDGIIDIQAIFEENGVSPSYFISGPPLMIKSFKHALLKLGVPAKNILTDDWE